MRNDETGFTEHYIQSADGLTLYMREYGKELSRTSDLLPVFCLPGLSRNSRDFHSLALALSSDDTPEHPPRRVICLDYRGRGQSDWDSDKSRYQLPIEAGDVLAVCATLEIERAIFIGTSRGGLILHLLSAMKPYILAAVILNDIGPVVEMEGLLHIRTYLAAAPALPSFAAASERLKTVHAAAFPALTDADWLDMAKALYRERDGQFVPDFDPALVEPLNALDENNPVPDLWALFDGLKTIPAMVIRGEHSNILSRATFEEMQRRHPTMTGVTAPGQGHAPILHLQPLCDQIARFIATIK
ncbi:alpha/beta fold hydrolase [Pararhizobium antarcticum]|uniref:Hydrolase n=1 Tax=Pararhizobium antarcticum TaxID=1798805 RepID=A0A657LU58_9HYPH|nr:alpha/beta hydrolase [Pararhizobium antarcticum]OJF94438.1 hydrolase [Pararhizobium antarcticum]